MIALLSFGNIAWADLEPCPFQKRYQCLRAFLIGYAGKWDAFGCLSRCLHLLLLDRVDPVDEMSQSGTIAFGRNPTLLTYHGPDRWKGEHLVSFSHRDRPVGLLQSQPLGASSRHATRPATRVAADTLAELRLSGRPPVADLIVTWRSLLWGARHGTSSLTVGRTDIEPRSSATASKVCSVVASLACLPVTRSKRRRIWSQ